MAAFIGLGNHGGGPSRRHLLDVRRWAQANLVWNPDPFDYEGPVEFEACVDYRPIETYHGRVSELPVELMDEAGRPLFFQRLEPESFFAPKVPWRVHPGSLPRTGSLGRIEPSHVRLLAFKPAEARDGWILRVRKIARREAEVAFMLDGTKIALGHARPCQIVTWKLAKSGAGWRTDLHDSSENPRIGAHADTARYVDGNAEPNGATPKDGSTKHRSSPAIPVLSET